MKENIVKEKYHLGITIKGRLPRGDIRYLRGKTLRLLLARLGAGHRKKPCDGGKPLGGEGGGDQ